MPPFNVVEVSSDEDDADCVIVKVRLSPSKHHSKKATEQENRASSSKRQTEPSSKSRQRTPAPGRQTPGSSRGMTPREQARKRRNGRTGKTLNEKKEAAVKYIRSAKPATDAKQSAGTPLDEKANINLAESSPTREDTTGQQQTSPAKVQTHTPHNHSRAEDSPTLDNVSLETRSRSCSTATLVASSPERSHRRGSAGYDAPQETTDMPEISGRGLGIDVDVEMSNPSREPSDDPVFSIGTPGVMDATLRPMPRCVPPLNTNKDRKAPEPHMDFFVGAKQSSQLGDTAAEAQPENKDPLLDCVQTPLSHHGALTQTHAKNHARFPHSTDSRPQFAVRLDDKDRSQEVKPSPSIALPQRGGSTRERVQPKQQPRPQSQMMKKPPGWDPRFNFEAFAAMPQLFVSRKKPLELAHEVVSDAKPTAQTTQHFPVLPRRYRRPAPRAQAQVDRAPGYRRGYRLKLQHTLMSAQSKGPTN